jgi:hypothetical protein
VALNLTTKKTPARSGPGGRQMKISGFLKGKSSPGSHGADSPQGLRIIVRQRQKQASLEGEQTTLKAVYPVKAQARWLRQKCGMRRKAPLIH